jgi:hypothetical protein
MSNNELSPKLKSEEKNNNIYMSINENKIIDNSSRDNLEESNEFIGPDHEIIWNYSNQNSYHYKPDIERVWLIIRNFDLLSLIKNKGHYPCISTKGQDTWKVGNEFKGNLFGDFPFMARVEDNVNLPEIKKIKWLAKIQNKSYIMVKIQLFKVTEDNTCVLYWKTKFEDTKMHEIYEEKCKQEKPNTLFLKVEEILENEPINLFQYESCIINANMIDIWNIVTDSNKISAIAPNNNFIANNVNISNLKVGEKFASSIINSKNELVELDITLKFKENNPGWNKWVFVLIISCDDKKKHPKKTVLFQLTKINKLECQMTLISKFHESISTEEFREISKRKKYLLLSLKDYFDNFHSPSC